MPDRLERLRPDPVDARPGRKVAERLQRRDAGRFERLPVRVPHARDEGQVVVLDPLPVAACAEVADPAVVARPRVRLRLGVERSQEPVAHAPVVRLELGEPERLALAAPVLDVDVLDGPALDAGELLGVEAELKDVRRLRRAGELRVDRLVAAFRKALEEVREPAPAPICEIRLVDHLRVAGANRLLRQPPGLVRVEAFVADRGNAQDAPPFRLEPREVGVLVLVALAEDQVAVRRIEVRPLELAARDGEREPRQVRAGEVGREVGGRERERAVVGEAHPRSIGLATAGSYGCARAAPRTARARRRGRPSECDPSSGRAWTAPPHQARGPVQVDLGAQRHLGGVRDVIAGAAKLLESPLPNEVDLGLVDRHELCRSHRAPSPFRCR